MKKDSWEPVARSDKDDFGFLKGIIMIGLTLLIFGVLIWII